MFSRWEQLSVAIVDRAGHIAAIQKSILRGVGVRNYCLLDSIAALQKDLILARDVVLINWTAASDEFTEIVRAIRNKETSPDPFVGILLIAPLSHKKRVRAALDAGANSFLAFPFRAGDLTRHLAHIATEPCEFVDVAGYFGPDRRRAVDPLFGGDERRLAQCDLLRGEALDVERQRMRKTAVSALEIKVSISQ